MKKIVLFFVLVLAVNLFSDEYVRQFYNSDGAMIGYSLMDFDFEKFSEKVEEFKKKIESGDKKAINNLANYYARNNFIREAKKYYNLAIENGSKVAKKNLELVEKIPFPITPGVFDEWTWIIPFKIGNEYKYVVRGYKVDGEELNESEKDFMKSATKEVWNRLFESADLEIVGYSDSREKKSISLKRAEKFAKFFREAGLKEGLKFTKIIGRGIENPVDNDDTVEGRYNNRRVEIIIKNEVEPKPVNVFELKKQLVDE